METKIIILPMVLAFLLFISNVSSVAAAVVSTTSSNTYKNYLKKACNYTTYPKLCYSSLSSYASKIKTNEMNLCKTALSITLKAAKNTSSLVSKLSKKASLSKSEASTIKDCIEEIGDCIDELNQSLAALGSLKSSSDVQFQISNIKTWVSAAITDENTCSDGFDETKVSSTVKSKIRKSILNAARLTSNALALINNLDY